MNYSKIKYSLPRARTDLIMLLVAGVSVVLAAIFATYSINDPGWNHSGSASEVFNVGGVIGAYAADIGYSIFGFMVFFVPVCIALFGWNYLYRWQVKTSDQLLAPVLFLAGALLALIGGCGFENLYESG